MSLKSKVFACPNTDIDAGKRALLERHHTAIGTVLAKAKALSEDSRRTLKDVESKSLRDIVKR